MGEIRILIASNQPELTQDLRKRLIKLGYLVVGFASSRKEIVGRIEELKPDLLLIDIDLNGERGGIKIGALLRSNFDKPIIYIAESIGQATIQRAKSTDPFGYLIKPFEDKLIYAIIETAILRYHLESELREGRQWLNAVLDGISDGVIALDDRGGIRFINPVAKQLTGWSEIQMADKTIDEIFLLNDESSHERVDVLGIDRSLKLKSSGARIEGSLLSKDGRTIPVEAEIASLEDSKSLTVGKVLVFRDIAQRREFVEKIQRQNQHSRVLVESAGLLNSQFELKSVLDAICSSTNKALNASVTGVFLRHAKHGSFYNRAVYYQSGNFKKYERMKFEIPVKLFKTILSEKKRVTLIRDIQSHPDSPYLEMLSNEDVHTVAISGLYRQHDLMGVLISAYIGTPIVLPEDTISLLKGLADQAVLSISNASLFEQVRRGREHQKVLANKLVAAQEAERGLLARELHDQVGQVLTSLQFILEASKDLTGETQLNKIEEAQGTVSELIEQIREMSFRLRPPMLDDIGLLATLLWYFERYSKQTGINVSFDHSELPRRLLPEIETSVYRILQEALTNIARHAQTNRAFVHLILKENLLKLEIIDHGVGFISDFEVSKWSTAGLAGMRERADMLGGYLVVNSAPNKGTKIQAIFPLDRHPLERRKREHNLFPG
jgi:PAS domain S-box-containing protein